MTTECVKCTSPAPYTCIECSFMVCHGCALLHVIEVFHPCSSIAPVSDTDKCSTHGFDLMNTCVDCGTLICAICKLIHHQGHKFGSITPPGPTLDEMKTTLHDDVEEKLSSNALYQEKLRELISQLRNANHEFLNDMDASFSELVSEILTRKAVLTSNVNAVLGSQTQAVQRLLDNLVTERDELKSINDNISLSNTISLLESIKVPSHPNRELPNFRTPLFSNDGFCALKSSICKFGLLQESVATTATMNLVVTTDPDVTKSGIEVIKQSTLKPAQLSYSNQFPLGFTCAKNTSVGMMVLGQRMVIYEGIRVRFFDCTGNQRLVFGKRGRGDGQFLCIGGMVADTENVYALDMRLSKVLTFTWKSESVWQFSTSLAPRAIAINSDEIFVGTRSFPCISAYSTRGGIHCEWGDEGAEEGMFGSVDGICANADNVFTSDGILCRIQVFGKRGQFVRSWKVNGVPKQICVRGQELFIIVSTGDPDSDVNCRSDRIDVFSLEGEFSYSITPESTDGCFTSISLNSTALYVLDRISGAVMVYK